MTFDNLEWVKQFYICTRLHTSLAQLVLYALMSYKSTWDSGGLSLSCLLAEIWVPMDVLLVHQGLSDNLLVASFCWAVITMLCTGLVTYWWWDLSTWLKTNRRINITLWISLYLACWAQAVCALLFFIKVTCKFNYFIHKMYFLFKF